MSEMGTTQRKPRTKSVPKDAPETPEPSREAKISVFPLQRKPAASGACELDHLPVAVMRLSPNLTTSYVNARGRRCCRAIDELLEVPEEQLFRALVERFHEDSSEVIRGLQDPEVCDWRLTMAIHDSEWTCQVTRSDEGFSVVWHVGTPIRGLLDGLSEASAALEHAPVPLVRCKRDLTIQSLNAAARAGWAQISQRWGLGVEQAPGASLVDLLRTQGVGSDLPISLSELPCTREFTVGDQRVCMRFAPLHVDQAWVGTSVTWEAHTPPPSLEERIRQLTAKERAATRSLHDDLDTLVSALGRVANGELGLELPRFEDATVQRVVDALGHLLSGLRRSVGSLESTAETLAASADQLTNVGERMLSGAHSTRERSESASKGSQDVHEHVLSVATSAEEMAASAREIAISASKAASVATHAVGVAEATSATVNELADSSEAIGKVVKVINSIAEQTNLLALNATIEAARAGEAGKGFAVVANEVKDLARETAKATLEIGDRIEAIQSDTQRVARAIHEIGTVVNQIHNFQATIATAVEQQHSVTTEISQRALGAAESSADIAEHTRSVQHSASSTAASAQETQAAARAVAATAFELKRIVSNFRP